jgi:hypothetical protein
MAYQRGDDRYRGGGSDRWRDRDQRPSERSAWGEQDLGRGYGRNNQDWGREDRDRGGDDRGFFERAGEQVRSWFSDDDDDQRERGGYGGRDRDNYGRGGSDTYGNNWSDRNRGRSSGGADEGGYARGFQSSGGGSDRFGEDIGGGRSNEIFGGPGYGGTSGFGGGSDHGRRFDRIDAGSTGTHGAHPMSSSVGGAYGAGYGISPQGGSGASSARYAGSEGRGGTGQRQFSGAGMGSFGGGRGSDLHDRHYSEWRNRQIDELDRDYDEYRREHQSKFEAEFGGWRQKRQGQRQSMGRVTEHMEVVGSDGQHIGTVDKVRGDRIILAKNDENAGGMHHSIPCSWIENVDEKVTVNKTAQEAMSAWRDEERNRALFEREDQGSEGPHMLNRSFSGTYSDEEERKR